MQPTKNASTALPINRKSSPYFFRKLRISCQNQDLDLQRGNFNRYCRDEFQRIDANLIIRLCEYLDCRIEDLLEIRECND